MLNQDEYVTNLNLWLGFRGHQGQCHLLDDNLRELEHSAIQSVLDAQGTKPLKEHRWLRLGRGFWGSVQQLTMIGTTP